MAEDKEKAHEVAENKDKVAKGPAGGVAACKQGRLDIASARNVGTRKHTNAVCRVSSKNARSAAPP